MQLGLSATTTHCDQPVTYRTSSTDVYMSAELLDPNGHVLYEEVGIC